MFPQAIWLMLCINGVLPLKERETKGLKAQITGQECPLCRIFNLHFSIFIFGIASG